MIRSQLLMFTNDLLQQHKPSPRAKAKEFLVKLPSLKLHLKQPRHCKIHHMGMWARAATGMQHRQHNVQQYSRLNQSPQQRNQPAAALLVERNPVCQCRPNLHK
jgi:hypothetical protein